LITLLKRGSMAGSFTKDVKDVTGTSGNNSGLGEKKEDLDCLVGNDSGLGEEAFPADDIVALSHPKLMFSHQQGPSYELCKESLEEAFFQFGLLTSCSCAPARTGYSGQLVFEDLGAAMAANYQLVKVGECEVYTSPHWKNLTARAVPHQVLLVCRRLPPIYERDMVVRRQFEEFGVVDAVEWWRVKQRNSTRLVVSFKEKSVALGLIGSTHVVFGEKVKVREVSAFTMKD